MLERSIHCSAPPLEGEHDRRRRVPPPDTRRELQPIEKDQALERVRELSGEPDAERAIRLVRAWVGEQALALAPARLAWFEVQLAGSAGALSLPTAEGWAAAGLTPDDYSKVDRHVPPAVQEAVLDLGTLGMMVSEVFPVETRGAAADVWVSSALEALRG